jgi:hypothetical protein
MRAAQVLRPKEPRNLLATVVVCLLLALIYMLGARFWPWSPKRGLGLAFGVGAAAIFVLEMLYPARRPRARPFASAKNWIQAHVYLGLVAFVAALIHAGVVWPRGGAGWWLLLLAGWTTASGLLGVWLQKWIPPTLSEGLRVEALYERIPELVAQLTAEADTLMQGAGDVLERFYATEVRPGLSRVSPSWSFLFDVRGGRDRALEPFRRISQFVDAAEKDKVEDLIGIYTEKMELDAHYSLQGLLRRWLVVHVPAAGLLMGLLAIHILTWVWY